MVPWRVSEGDRLYRDVHFPHGPLAVFAGAALDRLFGRSLAARTALAAAIALLHLTALGVLARRLVSARRAALATSIAIAASMFLRPGGWLFPFSFDAAIAVAALTGALAFAREDATDGARGAAGLCLLAALLARPDMALPAAAVLAFTARRQPVRLLRLVLFPLAAAGVVYAAVSAGIPRESLITDGWLRMIDPPEAYRNVYRAYVGLDRIGLRSAELLLATIVLLLIAAWLAAGAFVSGRLEAKSRGAARAVRILAIAGLAGAAAVRFRPPPALAERLALFPPLVRVVAPCLVIAALVRLPESLRRRTPVGPLAGVPDAVLWVSALFAARVLFTAGDVGPYAAFFLPLAIVVAVAGVFRIADRAAPALGVSLPILTAAALCVFFAARVAATVDVYRLRPWDRVPTPAGSLRIPQPLAAATRGALEDLARLPPGATLAGFPEAGFFNYVLGLESPFWLEQFFPGHLDGAGEARAIAVFERRPPTALLYANVLAVGEGARVFGRDYLQKLDAAARSGSRFASIHGAGAGPESRIGDPAFFVEIRSTQSPPR